MNHSGTAGLRVRKRLNQIEDRLGELRARSQELSESPISATAMSERLLRASNHASQAHLHAVEAARLARAAYLRSARVHERVADLYDRLVARGTGDTARYAQQADLHRTLAAKDRATATSQRVVFP